MPNETEGITGGMGCGNGASIRLLLQVCPALLLSMEVMAENMMLRMGKFWAWILMPRCIIFLLLLDSSELVSLCTSTYSDEKQQTTCEVNYLSNRSTRWLPTAMEHKWYVDEVYIALIRSPLWIVGKIFTLFDRYIIDGALVNGIASIPRVVAKWFSPLHNGAVQSYAVSMIGGAILIAILMLAFLLPEGSWIPSIVNKVVSKC